MEDSRTLSPKGAHLKLSRLMSGLVGEKTAGKIKFSCHVEIRGLRCGKKDNAVFVPSVPPDPSRPWQSASET